MTRWKLTIEYDGTGLSGWQKQANAPSVQQAIEQAIEKFCGEAVNIHVAGRTDAGVHARAQVAHIDLARETDANTLCNAINFHVRPNKIVILSAEPVDQTFHARFGAMGRAYRYRIVNRRPPLALQAAYAWHVVKPLDIDAMQMAADCLIGPHDFSTFRAQFCQAKSPIRTLDKLKFTRDGEDITLETEARSFLYHQVRNMVGSLVLVGNGQWTLADFKAAFAARDRSKGGPTAPAHGLCLWSVTYPQK